MVLVANESRTTVKALSIIPVGSWVSQISHNRDKILLVSVVFMGILATGCVSTVKESAEAQSQNSPGKRSAKPISVDVAIARMDSLNQKLIYTGSTVPNKIISVRSQVEGRLIGLDLDIGDRVSKGQRVGRLDDILLKTGLEQQEAELGNRESEVERARIQVGNIEAEVEKVRLELMQAKSDSDRQRKLLQEGAIPQQAAQQAMTRVKTYQQILKATIEKQRTEKTAVAAAQNRVLAQRAVVKAARERLSYTDLISPITGVVTEKITEPGNLLQSGNEVIKIADLSQIKVVVKVSELELGKVEIGQRVEVNLDAFPDQKIMGRIERISPVADSTARVVPVEIVIPNSEGKIRSGLLARVNFSTQESPRVVVLKTAINNQEQETSSPNNNSTIFVIERNKERVKEKPVVLGKEADGKIEIISGIQPGDSYVVRSSKPLENGQRVKLSALSELPN
ncbi:efflux RND transporter periplasmic adaptor subunit [Cylindrospermopsis curvispora]|uniref:Efflux RND transporter periplasmic adaptor subunit n=1 Tax=Cylindrospermopsis curvispora GIHE-G1 TaxID=2666332 RepID=A0A7H0F3Z5_9CYAN|nr:efflux RND transporter periplasmic adaptor subunit [Cylindrospermopsis curvispora]QNP30761.1 efflux RND transporter periplasmic adaptor subunit [Cylindrospermopsis curvispora GIHE-G1]